jgi:hypothetical protein
MVKYELCWTVSPKRPRSWQQTLQIDGLEIEVSSGRILVRDNSDDLSEDQLRVHAGGIVADIVRAMSFHESLRLSYEFSGIKTALPNGAACEGIAVRDGLEMQDNVTYEMYAYIKCDAVIVKNSEQVHLQDILSDFSRLRSSRQYSDVLQFIGIFRADPERHLAPLYNILEVAIKEFGNRKRAASMLNLDAADLSFLAKTANDPTIRTARHLGKNAGIVRDITASELARCERIAEEIIRAYAKRIPVADPDKTKDLSSLTIAAPRP